MSSQPIGTAVQLMNLLSGVFAGETWSTWRAILKAAFALELSAAERVVVAELTKRDTLPTTPVRELWFLVGRRAGKSIIAALLAVWATCCRSYQLAPGEVGVFMVVAADRKQARVVKQYVSGLLHAHPALEALIERETTEAIWLNNGLVVEVHTCSYKSLRGYTCIGAAVDEVAFWASDDSANPDREVLIALRAAMASVPDAMLVALTTTYARRGEAWRVFEKYFGRNDASEMLVVNGPTRALNPTIRQSFIDTAYEEDPIAAAAEYGGQFRRDLETFVSREAVEATTVSGRHELPPVSGHVYLGFTDPAGGSGRDSMTLAIAHGEPRDGQTVVVIDAVREVRPLFSPEAIAEEFAAVLKTYEITWVVGNRFGGEWAREQFRKRGISYRLSDRTKNELYRDLLPVLNSGRIELLDQSRLLNQLSNLERRTGRSGRDRINHPPGQRDDIINAVAGAAMLVARQSAYVPLALINRHRPDSELSAAEIAARDAQEAKDAEEHVKRVIKRDGVFWPRSQMRAGGMGDGR